MRVVFMGTPEFAVETLLRLLDSEHEVVGVVTRPDRPKGRGRATAFSPVKEAAVRAQIPVYQPKNMRDEQAADALRALSPDVLVVVAFGQILPGEVLRMAPYGAVNVHASLLPRYRGAAPIQWAVLNGERESGVTTMQMDEGLDTGDILLSRAVRLEGKETGGSLSDRLARVGAALLLETLDALEAGTVTPRRQGDSPTAYAKMLTKEMGEIDWGADAGSIERLIRGMNPWPSAYTHLAERTLKLWAADVLPPKSEPDRGRKPGTILRADRENLWIQTGDGVLAVREVQLDGKKRMETGAFLRGFPIKEGMII